jgi:plasmid stability protein
MGIVNVRNVPSDLHDALKERAKREGTSVAELIRRELPRIAREPSLEEIARRVEQQTPD